MLFHSSRTFSNLVPVLLASILPFSSVFAEEKASSIAGKVDGKDVAIIEVQPFVDRFSQMANKKIDNFSTLNTKEKEFILQQYVVQNRLDNAVDDSGVKSDKTLKVQMENVEKEFWRGKFLENKFKDAVKPEEVRAAYDKHNTQIKGKDEGQLGYIVVKTQGEASEIYDKVKKNPAKFAELAKTHSLDKGKSAQGIGGKQYILLVANNGAATAELTNAALTLGKGQISAPVQSGGVWYILRMIDRRSAQILPYEKLEKGITQQLMQEKVNQYMGELVAGVKIETQ
jgi:parvulin-like peptidyl-prolyl isomerase